MIVKVAQHLWHAGGEYVLSAKTCFKVGMKLLGVWQVIGAAVAFLNILPSALMSPPMPVSMGILRWLGIAFQFIAGGYLIFGGEFLTNQLFPNKENGN